MHGACVCVSACVRVCVFVVTVADQNVLFSARVSVLLLCGLFLDERISLFCLRLIPCSLLSYNKLCAPSGRNSTHKNTLLIIIIIIKMLGI